MRAAGIEAESPQGAVKRTEDLQQPGSRPKENRIIEMNFKY